MVIEHFGVEECDHDGECQSEVRMDDRGRYRNARMLKEVCAPTRLLLEQFHYVFLLSYLDLQQVVPTDALVVHLVVSVICVTTALVLNECEAKKGVS
jgi:hypothetical protein